MELQKHVFERPRLAIVRMAARLMGVPIKVRESFWLRDECSSGASGASGKKTDG